MKIFITVIFSLFILKLSILASIINVPADQSSIQAGINAATSGDTVLVADSTYFENINFMGKAITVASHFLINGDSTHRNNTIIDGSQPSNPDSGSVVSFVSGEDTNSVIFGFTITNGTGTVSSYSGSAIRSGGGIFCCNSGASIFNNNIIYNSCNSSSGKSAGGGVNLWSDSTLTPVSFVIVKDNQISYNLARGIASAYPNYMASSGGGLSITTTNALIYNNIITNNEINGNINNITNGAGLDLTGVTDITVVDGNLISQNTGLQRSSGGGVFVYYCTGPVFINNKIMNNNVYYGGGFYTASSQFKIENNLIINNIASDNWGGIFLGMNSDALIFNCTITNNIAGHNFGGVGHFNSNSIIMNSIIWGNQATIAPNIGSGSAYSCEVVYSDVQGGWPGLGNIDEDPLFAPDSIHLSPSSPCIGAGIDSIEIGGIWYYAPDNDFEGDPRPWPAACMPDMGADESPF